MPPGKLLEHPQLRAGRRGCRKVGGGHPTWNGPSLLYPGREEKGQKLYDWQSRFSREAPASVEAIEGFYEHWEKAMIACGVHNPENPKFLMPMTRQLFGRSGLTQTEIDLLRGICSAIICPKRERAGRKKP